MFFITIIFIKDVFGVNFMGGKAKAIRGGMNEDQKTFRGRKSRRPKKVHQNVYESQSRADAVKKDLDAREAAGANEKKIYCPVRNEYLTHPQGNRCYNHLTNRTCSETGHQCSVAGFSDRR